MFNHRLRHETPTQEIQKPKHPHRMMGQASTSGSIDFYLQAWTEGLAQHVEQVQEAYNHQAKQKRLAEMDVAALRAELNKARAENEEHLRIMEELQVARLAEAEEAANWKRAFDALRDERQRESQELTHLRAAHQIALKTIQTTQSQLQELMSLPMMPPPNAAHTEEIASLKKDKEELSKQVQELIKQLTGKDQQ